MIKTLCERLYANGSLVSGKTGAELLPPEREPGSKLKLLKGDRATYGS